MPTVSSILSDDYKKINANTKQVKISETELNKYLKKEYSGAVSDVNVDSSFIKSQESDIELLSKNGLARGSSNPWDQLKINNMFVPGLIKIRVSFENDVKQEKRPGYDYTKLKQQGANSKLISLVIKMNGYDYKYFRDWILPLLYIGNPDPNKDVILNLENISLEDYGIFKTVLLSYEQEAPEAGIVEVTLSLVESHDEVRRKPVNIKNIKLPATEEGIAADAGGMGYGR